MDRTLELLRDLTEAPGVPGQESAVSDVMRKYVESYATEVSQDNLGSFIARKGEHGPKIMIAGHMDEVGFMITMITKEGFLKFQTLGGWWEQVMLAQRVVVKTRKGDLTGVIGSKPPHILSPEERKKPVEHNQMFIDIGASSEEEAKEMGVRPGDPVIPDSKFEVMANEKILLSKAFDNRVGCALAVDVIASLAEESHPNTVYGVGTVQEEVGLRGALTSSQVIQPDIGFAVEVAIAGDMPGVKPEEAQSKLGKGPVILLYDASMVPHVKLRDFVVDVAEEVGIPIQFDAMARGGTDAGRMHLIGPGAPSLVIGVPSRYIHSHVSFIHRDDYENAVKLMTEVIKRLDQETVEKIKGF